VGKLDFGRVGRVIDHAIDKFVQLILETRKCYNQTVYLFTPSGDNSVPCKEDRLIILKVDGTGKYIAVSVATESQGAKPGEKIFFGRDPDGKIVSKITMLNDGLVSIDTDTETTGDASGDYKRTIKGKTTIIEKDDREYTNEKNVGENIKENKTASIEGDNSVEISGDTTVVIGGDENRGVDGSKTENIGGDVEKSIAGNKTESIGGNYTLEVSGNVKIKAGGSVTINGATINLN
jgi:hypothetical protein